MDDNDVSRFYKSILEQKDNNNLGTNAKKVKQYYEENTSNF